MHNKYSTKKHHSLTLTTLCTFHDAWVRATSWCCSVLRDQSGKKTAMQHARPVPHPYTKGRHATNPTKYTHSNQLEQGTASLIDNFKLSGLSGRHPHASILRSVLREVLLNFWARPLIVRMMRSRMCRVCTIKSTSLSLSTTILKRCWSLRYSSTCKVQFIVITI